MQRRVRYQAACGAILCLDLLVLDDLDTLICEHHEDFLIKRKDGTFIGVQVKTQLLGLGPFKANDEAVLNALRRFVALEIEFPNKFERFVLAANCDFYDAQEAETNLSYVIRKLGADREATFNGTMKKTIDDLSKASGCSKRLVRETLAKIKPDGNYPKFEDILGAIAMKIGRLCPEIGPFADVLRCADALLNRILAASALPCDQALRSHFVLSSSPSDLSIQTIIEHKRITREVLLSVLVTTQQVLLAPAALGNKMPLDFPAGCHRLEKKMATGGISTPSITISKDLQASAEHVLQQWIARYGGEEASRRRVHVDIAVRNQCAEAHDLTYSASAAFGSCMLNEVRSRLLKLSLDRPHVFGLKYEHLLGFVSLATQQCHVWWSDPFEISEVPDDAL